MQHAWPKIVMFELTNHCDLHCRHCPFHGDGVLKQRAVQHMPDEIWQSALREIASWDTDIMFQPWGMGEPLLNPSLWEVVRTAKTHPRLEVGFYTNGTQWTETDECSAIDSGLDWVCFSIDGLRKDIFEHYRAGASLDHVLGNLRSLHAARESAGGVGPEIRVNMVEYNELKDHADDFVTAMREISDSVMISNFREVGNRKYVPIPLPMKRTPCFQLDMILAVSADGRVAQCCEDQQVTASTGRFPDQSLAEIWNGEQLTELRRAHREGRYSASPHCADCDSWMGVYEHSQERGEMHVRERTAGTVYEFTPAPANVEE